MSWERTHKPGDCTQPLLLSAVFAKAGAIWKCDECGTRYEVTKTRAPDGSVRSGWRKV